MIEPNRNPSEIEKAVGQLAAKTMDAQEEVEGLTDEELAERLTTGRWTTLEVHEAGRRLRGRRSWQTPEG